MIKYLLKIIFLIGILTVISALIPNGFIVKIDTAIIYFLHSLYALDFFVRAETMIEAIVAFVDFQIGLAIFWFFHWALKHLNNG
jgi:hypothetical protein